MKDAKAPTVLILAVLAGGCKDGSFVEMIAGHPPFLGSPAEVMQMHVNEKKVPELLKMAPNCALPRELDELIQKCTSHAKEERYASFVQLKSDLQKISALESNAVFVDGSENARSGAILWVPVLAVISVLIIASALLFSNSEMYLEWKIRQDLADPKNAMGRLCQHLQDTLRSGDNSDAQRIEKILAEPTPIFSDVQREELYLRFFQIYRSSGRTNEAIAAATNALETSLLRNIDRQGRTDPSQTDIDRCNEVCEFLIDQKCNKQQFARLNHVFTRCSPAFYGPAKYLYWPIKLDIKTNDNYLNGEVGRAQQILLSYQLSTQHASALNDGKLLKELIDRIDVLHGKYGQCKYYFLSHIASGNYYLSNNDCSSARHELELLFTELKKKLVFSGAEMEGFDDFKKRCVELCR